MLALDHIHNNGRQDVNGNRLYNKAWKIKDKSQYQTLCYNCNWKKHLENLKSKWIISKEHSRQRNIKTARRLSCLSHYSKGQNKCSKCGKNDIEILCLNHINNDGNIHRKSLSKGKNIGGFNLYRWIIKNNSPPMFDVLHLNCNILKQRTYIQK